MNGGMNADLPERLAEFVKEKNPLRRLVTPDDVAGAAAFLASQSAEAITGIVLPVAAGEVMTL